MREDGQKKRFELEEWRQGIEKKKIVNKDENRIEERGLRIKDRGVKIEQKLEDYE